MRIIKTYNVSLNTSRQVEKLNVPIYVRSHYDD